MEVFLLCAGAAVAALIGGFTAIKNQKRLNLALGLTAGIILGLVAFDLLPEIARASKAGVDIKWAMIALVTGFLAFHIFEKTLLIHDSQEKEYGHHTHPSVGLAGAVALVGHSFLDGATIGIAFQASSAVGIPVAIAVIGHRFADGFNTANLMLLHTNKPALTRRMLWLAAAMPILGGLSTLLFSLSTSALTIYLGFFAGFLLYIGASDILPQAHSKGSSWLTIAATVAGAVGIFAITQLV